MLRKFIGLTACANCKGNIVVCVTCVFIFEQWQRLLHRFRHLTCCNIICFYVPATIRRNLFPPSSAHKFSYLKKYILSFIFLSIRAPQCMMKSN